MLLGQKLTELLKWFGGKSLFYTAVRNIDPRGLIIQVLINIYKYKYNWTVLPQLLETHFLLRLFIWPCDPFNLRITLLSKIVT